MCTERKLIIVTLRGTPAERAQIRAAAAAAGLTVNAYARRLFGLDQPVRRGRPKRVPAPEAEARVVHTPYGDFPLTRRQIIGVSVVRALHACRARGKRLGAGDFTTVEHTKLPRYREHVAAGWATHVQTYNLKGQVIPVLSLSTRTQETTA